MIDLTKCKYSDCISIDREGNYNDSLNGKYGYKVFYTVPKEELMKTGLFENIPNGCTEGELEFSVNENLEQVGEILLWMTINDNISNSYENVDYTHYEDDISLLVNGFKKKILKPGKYKVTIEFELEETCFVTNLNVMFENAMYQDFYDISSSNIGEYHLIEE